MPEKRPDQATTHLAGNSQVETRTWTPPSSAVDGERYVPGAVLAGRYRIVGLLGRGGMGEVYRADDLRLGQPVALKFLAEEVERDPARLELFLEEVRIARRISHPNVCRVHDVVEADGNRFLSMEFVDGEDLAGLLRRIGRLPEDKAVQIARQICAGLAAAHDEGIIHRDLKPANIMIDGRGRARITDFGLARESETLGAGDARSGTPAYMAPEQLAGRDVTLRSDLYALGLVLHELFTGERPFRATTLTEAMAERESGLAGLPSYESGVLLDQQVLTVIERCLEPEPGSRPASARHVAAALPGGDPLEAALAAGETPSPEMVADAAVKKGMPLAAAAGAVLFCVLILVVGLWVERRTGILPEGKAPLVLADRARELLNELGDLDQHDQWGYVYQRYSEADNESRGANDVDAADLPRYLFFYRMSPVPLVPLGGMRAGLDDPPVGQGQAVVLLDQEANLHGLEVWPEAASDTQDPGAPSLQTEPSLDGLPEEEEPTEVSPQGVDQGVDELEQDSSELPGPAGLAAEDARWMELLEHTGLRMDSLEPRPPTRDPPMFATERFSWDGLQADGTGAVVHAASRGGLPVWIDIRPAGWERSVKAQGGENPAFFLLLFTLFSCILGLALWLARTNLRNGRGDRSGAIRLALILGASTWVGLLGSATHSFTNGEFVIVWRSFTQALAFGIIVGILYLALEPIIRRRWPRRIVGWARLLQGRFLDPQVGRELLAGAVGAAAFKFLFLILVREGARALGIVSGPRTVDHDFLLAGMGVGGVLHALFVFSVLGVLFALGISVLIYVLARLLGGEIRGAAAVGFILAFGLAVRDQATDPVLLLIYFLNVALVVTMTFLRFGLLAIVTLMALGHVLLIYPVTRFDSSGAIPVAWFLSAMVVCVALYGAWTSSVRPGMSGAGFDSSRHRV